MTLTQDIANVVQSVSNMTDEVAGKMGAIDKKVKTAEQIFNQFRNDIQKYIPLPLNLFSNSMMRAVEAEGYPTGYQFAGCNIEAVHPYTKGFEGCYTEVRPSSAAANIDSAGASNPFWFGRYNKGSRINRGGLAGGWGGIGDGHILKVTSTASNSSKFFRVPVKSFGLFTGVRVRVWIKIVKGKIGIGEDNGYYKHSTNRLNNVITKEMTDAEKDGWILFDRDIGTSEIVSITGNVLNFGLPHNEDCEIYIALPYLYVPMDGKAMLVAAGETSASPIFTLGN